MRRASLKPPYTVLPHHYDQFVAPLAHVFKRARSRVLEPLLEKPHSVCDLCCGTGTTAVELARRGLRVYAVDLSRRMCRLARQKARREGQPVVVLCADMRSFRLPESVSVITCEFDALNHLPRKNDLSRVARSVARALRPGGYFYFDVNTVRCFKEFWTIPWFSETADFALVSHGEYDRRRNKGLSTFEWFLPKGKYWRRIAERYEEVAWTDGEIRRTLRHAGFKRIRSWDGARLIPAVSWLRPGCRIFYLAQKSNRRR